MRSPQCGHCAPISSHSVARDVLAAHQASWSVGPASRPASRGGGGFHPALREGCACPRRLHDGGPRLLVAGRHEPRRRRGAAWPGRCRRCRRGGGGGRRRLSQGRMGAAAAAARGARRRPHGPRRLMGRQNVPRDPWLEIGAGVPALRRAHQRELRDLVAPAPGGSEAPDPGLANCGDQVEINHI